MYSTYLISRYREIERYASEDDTVNLRPILNLMRINFYGENNLLHHFATNEHFLKFYIREVKILVGEIEDDDALRYCYYVLFSNGSKSK